MEISTWIQNRRDIDEFSKWIFLCRFDVESNILLYLLFSFYHFRTFSGLETYSNLIWYNADRCNFNDIDVITDIGTIGTICFGNFATTQIIMNKEFLSSSK